jgi:hypothetical protein
MTQPDKTVKKKTEFAESWSTYLLKGALMYYPASRAFATLNSNSDLAN